MSETHNTNKFGITTTRLETFSDGMLAIIITIMVLELKAPHGSDWASLKTMLPGLISYVMSFLVVGVYWGNHHHLLHTVKRLSSGIMLSNLNLLFWLSLVPFATSWMAENHFSSLTVAIYAALLEMCGFAYFILQKMIEACHRDDIQLKDVLKGQTRKGIFSQAAYISAIPLAFLNPYISIAIFFIVVVIWLVPDRNILKSS
ncbi:MAG: TMEM175 family protein [Bacteroidota bacterium]